MRRSKWTDWLLFFLIPVLIFPFAGCHTAKKAAKSGGNTSLENTRISSSKISGAIEDSYLHFQTLSARVHIDYKTEKDSYSNVTAYLRMKKDSVIWLSIRPFLGIEMARLLITPDSIKLRNNLKGKTESRSIKDMEDVIHIPFKFDVVESLMMGNPVIIPKKIQDFQDDSSNVSITFQDGQVICTYQWSKTPFLLEKSHFQLPEKSAQAGQQFLDYKKVSIGMFSFLRKIDIRASSSMNIRIAFDKVQFNAPVQFPF